MSKKYQRSAQQKNAAKFATSKSVLGFALKTFCRENIATLQYVNSEYSNSTPSK